MRDITVDARDADALGRRSSSAIEALDGRARRSTRPTARSCMHVGGKIEQRNKPPLKTRDDLSMAYTPGVARVCTAIAEDPDKAFQYTIKRNTVAVVSDGTAVLGLGDIGPRAAMPVMEGKAMLFKEFGGVDAFPICLDTKDPDEIVATVQGDRARLRRHQPRGHLRAALLRDRGPPQGRARHPGLPRRPARHRGRRARRAAERLQADGPRPDGPARARRRPRRGRASRSRRSCCRPACATIIGCDSRGVVCTERDGLPRRLDERDQALVRRDDEPRAAARRRRPT